MLDLYGGDTGGWSPDQFIGMALPGGVVVTKKPLYTYLGKLRAHLAAIRTAGTMLGVPQRQLDEHDLSKWSPIEFPAYAMHYYGPAAGKGDGNLSSSGGAPTAYAYAWHNHCCLNPHHHNHWIFNGDFTVAGSDMEGPVLAMPEHFAVEMVADWMGSSFAYTGSWDMSEWLVLNIPRITLHSRTATLVSEVLSGLGYKSIVWKHQFKRGI